MSIISRVNWQILRWFLAIFFSWGLYQTFRPKAPSERVQFGWKEPVGRLELQWDDPTMVRGYWDFSPIVIEKYKLIFWAIPKVSCQEWKKLFRRMHGYQDWQKTEIPEKGIADLPHDPRFNGLKYLWHYSLDEANRMVNDENWTRAIFLRDPLIRFLSAYLDKVKNNPQFLLKYTNNTMVNWSFSEFLDKVEGGLLDPHWMNQCEVVECEKWLPKMDFIGRFEKLAEDGEDLLRKIGAWEEFGSNGWGEDGKNGIFRGIRDKGHVSNATGMFEEYYRDNLVMERVKRLVNGDLKLIGSALAGPIGA